MDILQDFENWQIGLTAFLLIIAIGTFGYFSTGNSGGGGFGSTDYVLQGELVKNPALSSSAPASLDTEQIYIESPGEGCSATTVGPNAYSENYVTGVENVSNSEHVEIPFRVNEKSEGFNWISVCLVTDRHVAIVGSVNDLDELKDRASDSKDSSPNQIRFHTATGELPYELQNIELKQAEEN